MDIDLKAGVFKILRSDGETTAGAGFVVSDKGLLATCSHVVQPEESQKDGELRPEKINLIFIATGEQMSARVLPEFWQSVDREDVAILQLNGDLPAAVRPLPLGSSEGTSDHTFQTFGFPEFGPDEGSYGDGHILNPLSKCGSSVLQVSAPQVTAGFSGGPVLDTVTGRIVGMVTAIALPDKYGRMGETAYVTPSEILQKICPFLTFSDIQPYLGLAAFTEKETRFFFGRGKTVQALVEALNSRPRLLLVMGPSGSGKSSVVQAGLIPMLRSGAVLGSDKWGIIVARPANQPFDRMEAQGLDGASKSLVEAARLWLKSQSGMKWILLVLDQFEEFLVTCPSELRYRFWSELQDLLDSDLSVIIMPIMRDDFYSRFAQEAPPKVMDWIAHGIFPISACLEPEDLREIIEQPACSVGLTLEDGLSQVIISDVLSSCWEEGGRAGRSTTLPLLEFALTQVWERRDQGFLTHKAYQSVGKVSGSLTVWADEVCRCLEKEGLGQLTRRILTDLVNLGDESQQLPDSCRRRSIIDICNQQAERTQVHRVVQRLADARLVTTSTDGGQVIVEIIHDSLIREWSRLQRWLKKDRRFLSWERDLEKDAREWWYTSPEDISKRDEGRLLRGLRLDEAEKWLKERKKDLNETQIEFIQASVDWRENERKKKENAIADKERTRRRIIRGLILFSIFALVLASFAYIQKHQADEKTEEALARSLASQSEQIRDITGSLTESVLLAIESLRHKETLEGEIAIRRSLALLPHCEVQILYDYMIGSAALCPDGSILATSCWDGFVRLWDVKSGKLLQALEHNISDRYSIRSIAFSPNGQKIVSISEDRIVRIWDVNSGILLDKLKCNKSVDKVAFSPDTQSLAIASYHTVRIWNIETGKDLQELKHNDDIRAIAFAPRGKTIATASDDDVTHLWNVGTGEEIGHVNNTLNVKSILFSPDGQKLAVVCDDQIGWSNRKARIWNLKDGKELPRIEHIDEIEAITFSPDGRMLATASKDSTARIWDAETGKEMQRFRHDDAVVAIAFSPDGHKLATGCNNGIARLWDVKTGELLQRMEHNRSRPVIMVAFTPDGSRLVTASMYPSAYVWDIDAGKDLQRLEHNDSVENALFSPNGRLLATASSDGTARIWDVDSRKEVRKLMHNGSVRKLAFSPDGHRLATVSSEDTVYLWDIESGELVQKLNHENWVNAMAFSPDGQVLATGGSDEFVHIWDVDSGTELRKLEHDDPVINIKFNPDGIVLATSDEFKKVYLWDTRTGLKLQELDHRDHINALALSPNGRRMATSNISYSSYGMPALTRIWDVASGKELLRLKNDYDVNDMAFSPDGQTLAIASYDRAVHLLDTETGMELREFLHDHPVRKVVFSPDGHNLATTCDDQTAHLWDVDTGKELQRLEHGGLVRSITFSPDGSMLATASEDGTARIWILDNHKVIEGACHHITQNMTREDWSRFIPESDCQTCPREGKLNQSGILPWSQRQCQSCIGEAG